MALWLLVLATAGTFLGRTLGCGDIPKDNSCNDAEMLSSMFASRKKMLCFYLAFLQMAFLRQPLVVVSVVLQPLLVVLVVFVVGGAATTKRRTPP
jgi:hypothetical protein